MNSLDHHSELSSAKELYDQLPISNYPLDVAKLSTTKGHGSFAFCITLFNEQVDFLTRTLASLACNALYLKQGADHKRTFTACVMVDGRSNLTAGVECFFCGLGLRLALQEEFDRATMLEDENGNHLTVSRASLTALSLLNHCKGEAQIYHADHDPVDFDVMLCVKKENAGKLDSHAWFFRRVLPDIPAEFVCQIDVGASLAPDCLAVLEVRMSKDPACVAIAPCMHFKRPDTWSLLHIWQYYDVALQQVANHSISNLFGYMEVLPGLCSIYRRDAIAQQGISQSDTGVLALYFHGLASSGLLERNAFLAEDRLFGWSLLVDTAPGATLHYAREATVEADHCVCGDELLKQRRRWINGTLASRLYLASRTGEIFRAKHLSPVRKSTIFVAALWSIILAWMQFTYPIIFVLFFAVTIAELGTFAGIHISLAIAQSSALLCLGLWLVTVFRCRPRSMLSRPQKDFPMNLVVAISISSVIARLIFVATEPAWFICIVLVAFFGMCISTGVISGGKRRWTSLRSFGLYMLVQPGISAYLISYAYANFSNVSWGTKGATGTPVATNGTWDQMRDRFLIGWAVLIFVLLVFVLILPLSFWRVVVETYLIVPIGQIILGSALACWPKRHDAP